MTDHAHHWVYSEPAGAKSVGVCKLCGATEEAFNSTLSQRVSGWNRVWRRTATGGGAMKPKERKGRGRA